MWLKAQNEMAGLWPHAAMGPVERMVRRRRLRSRIVTEPLDGMHSFCFALPSLLLGLLVLSGFEIQSNIYPRTAYLHSLRKTSTKPKKHQIDVVHSLVVSQIVAILTHPPESYPSSQT